MHPKIKKFGNLLRAYNPPLLLSLDTLYFLKEKGATATEAAITLFSLFHIPNEDAEKFVYDSNVWEPEDINEIFDQTLIYLFYDKNNPNYQADCKKIRIPFNKRNKSE